MKVIQYIIYVALLIASKAEASLPYKPLTAPAAPATFFPEKLTAPAAPATFFTQNPIAQESKKRAAECPEHSVVFSPAETDLASIQTKQIKKRAMICDRSLALMHRFGYGVAYHLYIPKEHLTDPQALKNSVDALLSQEVMKYHSDSPDVWEDEKKPWNEETWMQMFNCFVATSKTEQRRMILLSEIPQLMHDIRSILKSFLLTSQQELALIQDDFLRKNSLRRAITYATLERAIHKKTLMHVELPLKLLIVQDRHTDKYITGKDAESILDSLVYFYITEDARMALSINYDHPDYEVYMLAHRQPHCRNPLSRRAFEELKIVVKKTPFDVGFDNIWSRPNGNAVIIDTEYKGGLGSEAVSKLGRYWIAAT